jgi:hypothetical protein
LKNVLFQKNKFSSEEDEKLKILIEKHGLENWNLISTLMGNRNPRQCRERWNNYVNPMLNREAWAFEEDQIVMKKYEENGPRWNEIARSLSNRSDNNVRNRWM